MTDGRRNSSTPAHRVLFSFSTRLGTPGIGTTAWNQVAALADQGVQITVACGSLERPLPPSVRVVETLKPAGIKLPYRALGFDRAVALHDRRTARLLKRREFDLVHCWPAGALATLRAAAAHGLPGLLERPNAHTRFAYEVVAEEHRKLGIPVDPRATHRYDAARLAREEAEYAAASHLLCPSDFVARTFLDAGFAPERVLRHRYGHDPERFPAGEPAPEDRPLRIAFVGTGEPRKGLHFALEAWLGSPASKTGRFLVCGGIEPAYREYLADSLAHPSVEALGQVPDPSAAMRSVDALVLSSLEEGSALVTYEARASGCVLLVSDRAGAPCAHEQDALVHRAGDVAALREHITRLDGDRDLLRRLRTTSLAGVGRLTWAAAGEVLLDAYRAATATPDPAPSESDLRTRV